MTQSIGEARGHLSVERYREVFYAMQTWKDTFKSLQTPVRLQLDTEGQTAFLSLPTYLESQEPFSFHRPSRWWPCALVAVSVSWHTGAITKQTLVEALERPLLFLGLLTHAMTVLLGDVMFTSFSLSCLFLNSLVCVRKIPKINRAWSKTSLGIFLEGQWTVGVSNCCNV